MNLENIKQPFLHAFPADLSANPRQRQTPGVLSAATKIVGFENAELLAFNQNLAEEIGLGKIETPEDEAFLNASFLPENIMTYATAYAGHQFGNWAGQLGDGRAIFAGEIENAAHKKTEIQWKGAGATPYSRTADGRAVLRSSVREFLMSEAMHHLNIPSTRALSLSLTGESVLRDILYDGHPEYEKGAVITRTAESFLRFGHFELIGAQGNKALVKQLADYIIVNYFKEISPSSSEKYELLFQAIADKTAALMVAWYRVGFVHGVMNTDNMSILGLTIDYGPFSFIDEYSLNFTPNTTDLPGRRYAFGKQAQIAQWNLWQLANALFPLINNAEKLEKILNDFSENFWQKHDEMMAAKFGLDKVTAADAQFFTDAQKILEDLKLDYTLFFNCLEKFNHEENTIEQFSDAFYRPLTERQKAEFQDFINKYLQRLAENTISKQESLAKMKTANPKFILRNYLLYEAIADLEAGDLRLFHQLWTAAQNPYEEIFPEFSTKRPIKYDDQTGCSTLSCSS